MMFLTFFQIDSYFSSHFFICDYKVHAVRFSNLQKNFVICESSMYNGLIFLQVLYPMEYFTSVFLVFFTIGKTIGYQFFRYLHPLIRSLEHSQNKKILFLISTSPNFKNSLVIHFIFMISTSCTFSFSNFCFFSYFPASITSHFL